MQQHNEKIKYENCIIFIKELWSTTSSHTLPKQLQQLFYFLFYSTRHDDDFFVRTIPIICAEKKTTTTTKEWSSKITTYNKRAVCRFCPAINIPTAFIPHSFHSSSALLHCPKSTSVSRLVTTRLRPIRRRRRKASKWHKRMGSKCRRKNETIQMCVHDNQFRFSSSESLFL